MLIIEWVPSTKAYNLWSWCNQSLLTAHIHTQATRRVRDFPHRVKYYMCVALSLCMRIKNSCKSFVSSLFFIYILYEISDYWCNFIIAFLYTFEIKKKYFVNSTNENSRGSPILFNICSLVRSFVDVDILQAK